MEPPETPPHLYIQWCIKQWGFVEIFKFPGVLLFSFTIMGQFIATATPVYRYDLLSKLSTS